MHNLHRTRLGALQRPPVGVARYAAALALGSSLTGLILDPLAAYADEFKVLPSIDLQARVDNNPLLQVGSSKTVFIATASPRLKLLSRGDRLQYSFTGGVDLRAYAGWDRNATDDERLSFSGSYLTTERSRVGLNASIDRITILDALEDNTGKLTVPARVTSASVRPNFTYLLDPVDEIDFSGFFADRAYNAPQLIDYREFGGSITLSRQLSDVDKVSLSVSGEHSEPDQPFAITTEIYSANVGWAHTLMGGLVARVAAGPVLIHRNLPAGLIGNDPDQTGYQASVGFSNPIDDLSSVAVDFSHQALPTGSGGVSQRDFVHLGVQRKLTPVLTLAVDAKYTHGDSGGLNSDTLDTLLDGSARLDWQLNDVSKLSLGYYHRRETFRTTSGRASSDGIFLSLNRSFGRAQ